MKEDFEFTIRVIKNKNNKLVHYPAIKQLIANWAFKWKEHNHTPVYNVYLNSLNLNLKNLSNEKY